MTKIAFFEVETWEESYFRSNFPSDQLIFFPQTLEPNREYTATYIDASILSTFAYSQLTAEVLEKFPQLQFIATRSTGYDHIDMEYCKKKGILVSNVPGYGAHTIAEHTFALLLSLSRKIIVSVERTKKGDFTLNGLEGVELYQKTLGVIGTGNIGALVCTIGLAFGMRVVAYNKHTNEELEKLGVQFLPLEEVLSSADVVTVHVPFTPETKHLINMQNIEKMKKGSFLINTARGPIVETQAILTGLEKGILRGAGLDVLEEECNMREERELLTGTFWQSCDIKAQLMNHILLNRDDVIITPHNAFHSRESMDEILRITVTNIRQFLAGSPQNRVSK